MHDGEGATTVGLDHTFVSDLTGTLTAPGGATATLFAGSGGGGNNLCKVVFDDAAAAPFTSVLSSQAPFTGSWRPDDPLDPLLASAVEGDWTLKVVDDARTTPARSALCPCISRASRAGSRAPRFRQGDRNVRGGCSARCTPRDTADRSAAAAPQGRRGHRGVAAVAAPMRRRSFGLPEVREIPRRPAGGPWESGW